VEEMFPSLDVGPNFWLGGGHSVVSKIRGCWQHAVAKWKAFDSRLMQWCRWNKNVTIHYTWRDYR